MKHILASPSYITEGKKINITVRITEMARILAFIAHPAREQADKEHDIRKAAGGAPAGAILS